MSHSKSIGQTSRAQRIRTRIPIRYRPRGERGWILGKTENLSCTGMLFHGAAPLEPHTPVELGFILPAEVAGETPVQVTCNAFVVRLEPIPDHPPCIAVALSDYTVLYPDERLENRLRQMLAARKAQVSPVARHDLANQLAIVIGKSELALERMDDPDALTRVLEQIKAAALHAASLLNR